MVASVAQPVNQDQLDQVLVSNLTWADCGVYESLAKAQAADGEGLASQHKLLKQLLSSQPGGNFLLTQVRSGILKVCGIKPDINKSELKNLLWAGSRFDKMTCMLYHLRRAKRDSDKLKQLVGKTSPASYVKVKELLDMLQVDEKEPKPVKAGSSESLPSPPAKPLVEKADTPEKIAPPKQGKAKEKSAAKKNTQPDVTSKGKPVSPPGQPEVFIEEKPAKPVKKDVSKALAMAEVKYRKEWYKNFHKYGFKKFENQICKGQLFTFGGKQFDRGFLDGLALKVLADLNNKAKGDTTQGGRDWAGG